MTSRLSDSDRGGGESGAFSRLNHGLQKWIWQQGWKTLHEIQEAAVPVILDTDRDVIISAATAGGKTEAAFLPVLSNIAGRAQPGFSALCVSPLKALINDQHRRLEGMAKSVGVSVHRRHGDVPGSAKAKALQHPSGILLITPESLEALFVRRGTELRRLFAPLSHVVLDELHVFIGTERGKQVQSLLHRLELILRRRVPRVGLSATIGDMDAAGEFLRPGSSEPVEVIRSESGGAEVRLQVRGYEDPAAAPTEDPEASETSAFERIVAHLLRTHRGSRNLIFINRKSEVERYADALRRSCERERVPNEFFPHHGSLSKTLREDVETLLKEGETPTTAICTSTLELGIDIGAVENVAQVGAPPAVASMRQRLGRSGRRGNPATLRIYIDEPEITSRSTPLDRLRLELFETVAMVRLLIQRWYEPPQSTSLHLSTLIQQVLSVLAQLGGARADQLWGALCGSGPFGGVSQAMFAELLRALGEQDLVLQSSEGLLLPGVLGERLVNHYDFYSAFTTDDEYTIEYDGKQLGTIPIRHALIPDQMLVFAGRRWTVVDVDDPKKRVFVSPARGGTPPKYSGGSAPVHDEVRREMYRLYVDKNEPAFLDSGALELLEQGRDAFRRMKLQESRFYDHGSECLAFLWAGDRVLSTILAMLSERDVRATAFQGCLVVSGQDELGLISMFEDIDGRTPPNAQHLAAVVKNKVRGKHDRFLSDSLLSADYASRDLDVEGALATIEAALRGYSPIAE